MPSSNSDQQETPTKVTLKPKPKPKPKSSPNAGLKNPATLRRTAAVKRTPNGTPNSTPIRKAATPKTPNTAPARTRAGGTGKKVEPTLLGDFLLGRPSPSRRGTGARRRSLDVLKREMRLEAEVVRKVPPPGGVKDRVKQWQKASAAAGMVCEEEEGRSEPEDGFGDGIEEGSVGEADRLRIKMRERKRPGRRKSREDDDEAEKEKRKERSKSAPRKRVISDDHWMIDKKKSLPTKGSPIPKDFLKATATNPPLEKKIQDWVKRIGSEEIVVEVKEKPSSEKVSKNDVSGDTSRKTLRSGNVSKQGLPDDGIRVHPLRVNLPDDGIRIKPSLDPPMDDGIQIKPSSENSVDDGIRFKPMRKKKRPKEHETEETRTPRKSSERQLRPPDVESRDGDANEWESHVGDDPSFVTPRRPQKSKRRDRKPGTPDSMDDIPFGNSAFSVLDLPVGAEAHTLRRPPPKRNNSFAVPKVLKKIYNEGMNIARDTVDPPRAGPNQPPSIESWLNETADPFIDRPAAGSTVEAAESPSRTRSYKEEDPTERDLTAGADGRHGESRRSRRVRSSHDLGESAHKIPGREGSPLENRKARDSLPSIENSPYLSPTGLRRTPATRNIISSPKSARKLPLKDLLLDAFRGESAPIHPKSFSSPLGDISVIRGNSSPPEVDLSENIILDDPPQKRSPRLPDHASSDVPKNRPDRPLRARPVPITGEHRLSTIASVETFSTSSSVTGTASELSQTTVTQDTVLTGPTSSSLSRKSKDSGLKRRLTRHSDLISMLSLPDNTAPGRAKSIRSARSIRTERTHLETATMQDLFRELADDEAKYMRELKTLVDGVIPVLLTCVLSKSDSAIAAGLFNPNTGNSVDYSFTKPIVDMGVALEQLKSLHKRIPLKDPHALIAWAQSAHKTYKDYLASWRMGFQEVVINLTPASPSRDSFAVQESTLDEMPHNADGDVVNDKGERVDVAFLLKRPLARVKYVSKILKVCLCTGSIALSHNKAKQLQGVDKLEPSELSAKVKAMFQDLEDQVRRRFKEERARIVDRAANNTDPTRARDLKTMALAEGIQIDRTRQVCAKDFFSLELHHSNGQRLECRVELMLRDKPSDPTDPGDVLVCVAYQTSHWLLFPPLPKDFISARLGAHIGQVVVMVRGIVGPQEWHECFILETDEDNYEAATEWVEMLGTSPVPPPIAGKDLSPQQPPSLTRAPNVGSSMMANFNAVDVEIPIGERRQAESEETSSNHKERRKTSAHTRIASTLPYSIKEESIVSEAGPRDLNEAMNKAGQIPIKRARPERYHSNSQSQQISCLAQPSSALEDKKVVDGKVSDRPSNADANPSGTIDLSFIPKVRNNSATSTPKSSSSQLEVFIQPEADLLKPVTPACDSESAQEDGAPLPPVHGVRITPNTLKNTPVLETPTPKAKARISSSPLKHEYQPSDGSGTSSSTDLSDSQDEGYSTESSDEELEAAEFPQLQPGLSLHGKRVSPSGSINCLPNSSLASGPSASQAPSRGDTSPRFPGATTKLTAMISSWSNSKGCWEDLYPEPCSIIVSPGQIEAWEMSAAHSSPIHDPNLELSGGSDPSQKVDPNTKRPLILLELTPVVSLRQSTSLDIEIQSPPRPESRLKSSGTVRYRASNSIDCQELYHAIHFARLENPTWKKLEEERMVNSYGTHAYEAVVKGNRRRSWFGRKRSYRATTRAPSTEVASEQSGGSNSSAFSVLKRMTRGGIFNIHKSSIETGNDTSGPQSMYTSSSDTSGITPPRTSSSPSLAGISLFSMFSSKGSVTNLGSENLKIRLYLLVSGSRWSDKGEALLTVTQPPPGMRQASSLYNGTEKRITVTRKGPTPAKPLLKLDKDAVPEEAEEKTEKEKDEPKVVLLDVVLGANCFSRQGNTGIAVNIWEDIMGDNGQIGMVGAVGRVSGRTRTWLFATLTKNHADWIFGLLAVGC